MAGARFQRIVIQDCDFISYAREILINVGAQTCNLGAQTSDQLLMNVTYIYLVVSLGMGKLGDRGCQAIYSGFANYPWLFSCDVPR